MAGWYHQCNGHELGQALGDGEGQQGLACCNPWGHKKSDMTERLSNNNKCNTKRSVVLNKTQGSIYSLDTESRVDLI